MTRFCTSILLASTLLAACAPAPLMVAGPQAPPAAPDLPAPVSPRSDDLAIQATDQPGRRDGAWIGAAGESDYLLAGVDDTVLGVWVDVPSASRHARAPADVALVIDTSGSMAGPKIENARAAARTLVDRLANGDIVPLVTFSDEARELVRPTVLDSMTRAAVLRVIAGLEPSGSTNMFDGLRWAERNAATGPRTHPVRRVVMISDGNANVGPSSPEALGDVASRGADAGVQVSAIGVGLDYDEHTLDALAVRSSGRLYHLDDPREMTAILDREIRSAPGDGGDERVRRGGAGARRDHLRRGRRARRSHGQRIAVRSRSARCSAGSTASCSCRCASRPAPRSARGRARSRACGSTSATPATAVSSGCRRWWRDTR